MLLRICAVLLFGLVAVAGSTMTHGNAASVTIPTMAGVKRVTDPSQIGPNKFKPSQCASLSLTNLVVVTGSGGSAPGISSLVIGDGSESQTISGGGAADCVIAGGASTAITNSLNGGGGADVLIGGKNAKNTYNSGTGTDTCYYRIHDTIPSSKNCDTRILLP